MIAVTLPWCGMALVRSVILVGLRLGVVRVIAPQFWNENLNPALETAWGFY